MRMFKDLDPILHSQLRLAVMSLLIGVREAEFTFLREKTNSTAGNLSVQIQKLKDAGYITLNIDLIQMGVGGNDSWSDVAAPLEKYQIPAKEYNYSFYILPVKGKTDVTEIVKKVKF